MTEQHSINCKKINDCKKNRDEKKVVIGIVGIGVRTAEWFGYKFSRKKSVIEEGYGDDNLLFY
jgi:hypothetical protein